MKATIHVVLVEVNDPARRALIQAKLERMLEEIRRDDPEVDLKVHDDHESYVRDNNPLCGQEAPVYRASDVTT